MRLRPSGAAGLLVSSLGAFQRYQENEAWTWEHQALVRARVLVGCSRLAAEFARVRAEVLGRQRDVEALRVEVSECARRCATTLATKIPRPERRRMPFEATSSFDLKQDAGGIVDIEFMVQYAALAWSWQHPQLLEFTDNIRILEGLERVGLMSAEDAALLREVYKNYRSAAHRQALQKQPGVVPGDQFQDERRAVMRLWRELGLS